MGESYSVWNETQDKEQDLSSELDCKSIADDENDRIDTLIKSTSSCQFAFSFLIRKLQKPEIIKK